MWHPAIAKREEIEAWQNRILEDKIQQPERQAFREHYPFSENESRINEASL
ncbi:MAG: DUF4132 domain-containing protein [Crocinitomicaceae bacterium]|nr:DUF4132 domain-containing protein [Crocinitomicaceae bacterium]